MLASAGAGHRGSRQQDAHLARRPRPSQRTFFSAQRSQYVAAVVPRSLRHRCMVWRLRQCAMRCVQSLQLWRHGGSLRQDDALGRPYTSVDVVEQRALRRQCTFGAVRRTCTAVTALRDRCGGSNARGIRRATAWRVYSHQSSPWPVGVQPTSQSVLRWWANECRKRTPTQCAGRQRGLLPRMRRVSAATCPPRTAGTIAQKHRDVRRRCAGASTAQRDSGLSRRDTAAR